MSGSPPVESAKEYQANNVIFPTSMTYSKEFHSKRENNRRRKTKTSNLRKLTISFSLFLIQSIESVIRDCFQQNKRGKNRVRVIRLTARLAERETEPEDEKNILTGDPTPFNPPAYISKYILLAI